MSLLICPKKKNNTSYILKSIGVTLLFFTTAFIFPKILQETTRYIKEKGIIEYLEGEVEIIQSDSTYMFLWIDCD